MGIDFGEILIIVIIALMVYGRNLPDAARKLAAFYVQIRRKMQDAKRDFSREIHTSGVVSEVKGILDTAKGELRPEIDRSALSVNDLTDVETAYRDADRPEPTPEPAPAPPKDETTPPQV